MTEESISSLAFSFRRRHFSVCLSRACSPIHVDLGPRYLGCLSAARRFASRHVRRSLNAAAFLANVAVPSAAAVATSAWRFVSPSIDTVKWAD